MENDNAETLKSLVDGGAVVNKTDSDNNSMLMLAVESEYNNCADYLIKAGADVNITNSEGMKAIKQAAIDNNDKCLEILIKVRHEDGQPKTPLPGLFDLLRHPNRLVNIRCLKLLMAAGAKINENGVEDNFLLRYSLRSDSCPMCVVDPGIYRLMAAAGEVGTKSEYVGEPA